jgi:hypothetical protein
MFLSGWRKQIEDKLFQISNNIAYIESKQEYTIKFSDNVDTNINAMDEVLKGMQGSMDILCNMNMKAMNELYRVKNISRNVMIDNLAKQNIVGKYVIIASLNHPNFEGVIERFGIIESYEGGNEEKDKMILVFFKAVNSDDIFTVDPDDIANFIIEPEAALREVDKDVD